jgi:hypothetical protein
MKKLALSIAAIMAINNHSFLIAQRGNCAGEHNYCFPDKGKNKGASKDAWQYNNQSKSGLFAQNETTEITMVTYANTEYMLAFCSDNDMLEGKIQFKLYDFVTKQVEKKRAAKYKFADPNDTAAVPRMIERDTVYKEIAYEKSKKLLFDNTKKENVQHFEFISEKTRKMLVEVFVPSTEGGAEASTSKGKKGADDKEIKASTYSCVGMLVMHQKALATGFQK